MFPMNALYANGYLLWAFNQNDYTKDSQIDGAIDYIKWCASPSFNVGPGITYGLKSFCKGKVTDAVVKLGNTELYNAYPAYC